MFFFENRKKKFIASDRDRGGNLLAINVQNSGAYMPLPTNFMSTERIA